MRVATVAVMSLAFGACSELPTAPEPSFSQSKSAPGSAVVICHRVGKGDDFKRMTVSELGLTAHHYHGDGAPGGTVPGSGGALVFDLTCDQVPAGDG